jgi:hypothetical protein
MSAFRKKTLSSTIKILNFFIAFELEFEETISPLLSYIFPLQCPGNKWGECCIRGREWQYFKGNFPKFDMNDFGLKCCGAEQKCKNNITGRKFRGTLGFFYLARVGATAGPQLPPESEPPRPEGQGLVKVHPERSRAGKLGRTCMLA